MTEHLMNYLNEQNTVLTTKQSTSISNPNKELKTAAQSVLSNDLQVVIEDSCQEEFDN